MRLGTALLHQVDGLQKTVDLPSHQLRVGTDVERRRHEVLVRRVLLESSHEVGDGDVELARIDHGGVQQQPADLVADRVDRTGVHAQQHLERDGVADAPVAREQPCVRDVEQVLAGHADLDRVGAIGCECPVEHPLVAGIGLDLAAPRGQRPAVDGRVDALHREIGSLDDADLDRRTARSATDGGPALQVLHGAQRIGEVGLQHDAGLELREPVHDRGEDRNREVEVAVLLHVEVDEGVVLGGLGVQGLQLLDDPGDGFVEGPHRQLAGDRRHLDRHVVDVGTLQQAQGRITATLSLAIAEHGLAEQVQVQTVTTAPQLADRLAQRTGSCVDHEVADHATQRAARRGDDERGGDQGDQSAELEEEALDPGEEGRCAGGEVAQVAGCDTGVLGSHDTVDEGNRELEAVGVLEQLGETARRWAGSVLAGLLRIDPCADEFDAAVGQCQVSHLGPHRSRSSEQRRGRSGRGSRPAAWRRQRHPTGRGIRPMRPGRR